MADLRFSDLSAARQALVRTCQHVGFGKICGLVLRAGEPVFVAQTEIHFDLRLDRDEPGRPELELPDFALSLEVRRLFLKLDAFPDGNIESVEVSAGLPRRMVFSSAHGAHN